ncbi:MAG: hypothetical protein DRJ69_05855 [Thermoprotei archaeon]|nr:MAG: hypothetical protein DRJ69_05855 [Thermoprotei archaeon]
MKLGLSLLFAWNRPLKKAIRALRRALDEGVELVELIDEGPHSLNKKRIPFLKREISSLGLEVSVHGPFVDVNIGSPYEPARRMALKRHFKSMEMASSLGAIAWIFHPGLLTGMSFFYPGVEWRQTLKSVRELQEKASELGLSIFLENGPDPVPFVLKRADDFSKLLSELECDIRIAFDIGHAFICGQVEALIDVLGDRIGYVHAHDNDGSSDAHMAIGSGDVDWRAVMGKLKAIGYDGPIVVESVEGVWESLRFLKTFL